MKLFKLTLVLLTLVITSCGSLNKSAAAATNGNWILANINNAPINRMVVVPTLVIDVDALSLSGNGGCNRYGGPIDKLTATDFVVSDKLFSTMMACANQNIESEYLEQLAKVKSFKTSNDLLKLYDASGNNVLTFIKQQN